MASAHKVKIAARLRPRLNGELDDESVKVYLGSEDTGESSSVMGSGRFISVTNPRDPSQVFKFPCVISETTVKGIHFKWTTGSRVVMINPPLKRRSIKMTCSL